jgi:hypothetical protein
VIAGPCQRASGHPSSVNNTVLWILLLAPAIVHAQAFEPAEPQLASPSMVDSETTGDPAEYTSPSTALALSLGTTLGGVGLVALGESLGKNSSLGDTMLVAGSLAATIGPSLGHVYAGHTWNGGLGMRLAGGVVVLTGAMVAFSACPLFDPCTGQQKSTADFGGIIAVGGALLYGSGLVYEIATAPAAARENNREHSTSVGLTFAPVRSRNGTSPGLALVGRF